MNTDTDPYKNRLDASASRTARAAQQKKKRSGFSSNNQGHPFRSFVLTILLVLLVFVVAFSATFYARSRGWLKGKAPADSTVIRRMFQSL